MNTEIKQCPNCNVPLILEKEIEAKYKEQTLPAKKFKCPQDCGYGCVDLECKK